MSIATTIRDQIGRPALFMLGAKNLMAHQSSLSFRIRGSSKVNYVKVTLNGNDLYDMEFGKVWGHNYTIKAEAKDVYADQLHDLIETNTGLYTRL